MFPLFSWVGSKHTKKFPRLHAEFLPISKREGVMHYVLFSSRWGREDTTQTQLGGRCGFQAHRGHLGRGPERVSQVQPMGKCVW